MKTHIQTLSRAALGCAVAFAATSPALANDDEEALEPFRECGAITDSTARLACFDNALAGAAEALAERRERRRRRTVADFGLSSTQIEARENREREQNRESDSASFQDEPDEIASPVSEVVTDQNRRRLIFLENGQIWRETSNSSLRGRIRVGKIATVSRGGVGGFRMRIEDRRGYIGVRRVR